MQNNKITSRPPVKKSVQDFILEAENRERVKEAIDNVNHSYPWQDDQIRPDVQKVFTVRLPEEYTLKIKYLSEVTNKSQQKIVREIINAGINEALKTLGGAS
ncbi:MAG: hypothetical protein NWS20_05670 [Rickettsiaceae bacterium]|nr:hypothetical protein [Rickettsiaceae bacterium]